MTTRDVAVLQEGPDVLRLLAESAEDYSIFLLDALGHIATWNCGANRLYKFTDREAIGCHLSTFFLPEDVFAAKPAKLLAQALSNGRAEEIGWRRRQDETIFRTRVTVSPIYGDSGEHVGFAHVTRDLTRDVSMDMTLSVLDNVLDGIISIDDQGTVLSFNQAAERIFGYPAADVIGKDIGLLMPEPYRNEHTDYVDRYLRTGQAKIIGIGREVSGLRSDGTVFPMRLAVSEFSREGRRYFTGVVHDRTEEVQRAAERSALLTRHQLYVERMPLAYVLLDAKKGIRDWNPAAERIFGFTRDEMLGEAPSYARLFPKGSSLAEDQWLHLSSDDGQSHFINECSRKDGRTITCEWFRTSMYDEDGAFAGCLCLAQDITERLNEEMRLRSVLDNASDAILTVDSAGLIQTANRAAERIYGYAESELLGQPAWMLATEDMHVYFRELVERMCAGEIPQALGIEGQALHKDGTLFPFELGMTAFTVRGRNYVTGISRDVSERKKLEAQLRQSQKLEAIGKLAGGVAHDFNNMLTVIIAYSQMTLPGLLPESPEHENITEVLHAGERAALITQQLLAFSRQQVLSPRILNLNNIVAETEKMLRRLIGEDISVATVLDPQLPRVLVDQGQMVQILLNLAVNARDAMPQGGKLTIETRSFMVDEERAKLRPYYKVGSHAWLAISDNGCGMPSEVQARIFEPFFTTKPVGEGTGLGLSTVFGIVKQSGGNIEVYSEPGHGTTFKIYIPAVDEADSVHNVRETANASGGTETILLVEDDAAVRKVALSVLQQLGYKVLEAKNGPEAISMTREHPGKIDLLLTDLIMPEMSGHQVAEAILGLLPKVKVLYMSGYTDDAVVRHGLISDKVSFLQKPFTPASLGNMVRKVLDETKVV